MVERAFAAVGLGALLLAGALAFRQARGHDVPRLPGGRPNFNGVWQALTPANYDVEAHDARAALAFRPGPVVPVPAKAVVALGAVGAVPAGLGVVVGGKIPYRPEALARKLDNQAHWLERDPEIKCYLPGVPRATYLPFPFQIVQSGTSMLFAYEYDGATRHILFRDPGPAPVDSWMGQSVARWEGDTLVVEVTGQNDQTWLDRAGNFHGAGLHVTERYRFEDRDHLLYEAELTDPETYTRPWRLRLTLYRRVGDDARLLQFKCVEFVEELMYGNLRKEPLR
jgi:hypothetical protein